MTGVWPRSTAASGVATGGRSTEGLGRMSTRMRPTLTPEPTWAAYVTVDGAGRLARHGEDVGVEVGVERELARALDGLREAHAGLRVGRVGAGDVVAERLELDRLADDGAQRRRAGSSAGPALLSCSLSTSRVTDACWVPPRPSSTEYSTTWSPLLPCALTRQRAGAVDARWSSGRPPRPGSGRSRRRASRRRRRRARSRSATTGYFAWASLAWPARSFGGVLVSDADDADGDLGGGPAVLGRRAVVDGVVERERAAGLLRHRDLDGLAVGGGARRDARRRRAG